MAAVQPLKPSRLRRSCRVEDVDKAAFEAFDSNSQGFITRRELKYALRGLGFSPSKEEIAQLLAKHARVTEGSLTEQEFRLVTQRLRDAGDPQKCFHQMFQLLDTEAAGFVTVADLQQVAEELGLALSQKELAGMVQEFDSNADGRISEQDFLGIMSWQQEQNADAS